MTHLTFTPGESLPTYLIQLGMKELLRLDQLPHIQWSYPAILT